MKKLSAIILLIFITHVYAGCNDLLGNFFITDAMGNIQGSVKNNEYHPSSGHFTSTFTKFKYFPGYDGINEKVEMEGSCYREAEVNGTYFWGGLYHSITATISITMIRMEDGASLPYYLIKK